MLLSFLIIFIACFACFAQTDVRARLVSTPLNSENTENLTSSPTSNANLETKVSQTITNPQKEVITAKADFVSDDLLTVRVKDVATIEGVRDNYLVGYGLVIGLNRTGDKVQQNLYTRQTLQNLLERMGISVRAESLKPENIATVLLTAVLPAFVHQGTKIDVTISAIGDAKSLAGGTLVLSPLKGIDGQIYALAQGSVSIGGISAGGRGNSIDVNHPTVGRIPNGATVERSVSTDFTSSGVIILNLREQDFTTASRVQEVINKTFGECSQALDGRNITVYIPTEWRTNRVGFISKMELLRLQVDTIAKVIINERTGTIVMGRNVRLSSVAISQGGVTVQINSEIEVSQPNSLSNGKTTISPKTNVSVEEKKAKSIVLQDGATVDEVVRGLRAVGVTTSNIISILQAIKSAGALNADLEIQ
ncbi:MAG: flagellar basal body P-ring protein FlgI [Blastocatellia bacterium]